MPVESIKLTVIRPGIGVGNADALISHGPGQAQHELPLSCGRIRDNRGHHEIGIRDRHHVDGMRRLGSVVGLVAVLEYRIP